MASTPVDNKISLRNDAGFASITAIILCAALSLICTALLSLVMAQERAAQRELFRTQQNEAIHTAVMQISSDMASAPGTETTDEDKVVETPEGPMNVKLTAQFEGSKWPSTKAGSVDEDLLARHTSLTKSQVLALLGNGSIIPKNDCIRSLFSRFGEASVAQDQETSRGLVAIAGGHDGEVWRIRATADGRLEDLQVRFLGNKNHIFVIVAEDDMAMGEMPQCSQPKSQP